MNEADAGEARVFGGGVGERSWLPAALRGMRKKCPACGVGALFASYSRVHDRCTHCGLDFSGHQADDAPPYVTILIVGHVTIPLALAVKELFDPPLGLQFLFWTPVIFLAALWLLPVAKGGLIGLQWANRMHGFADAAKVGEI